MRGVAFFRYAGAVALIVAGATASAQTGRGSSSMTAGTAQNWSNVPRVGLNPPPPSGGWGPNGWQGGAGAPGRPAGPPPRADAVPPPSSAGMTTGFRDGPRSRPGGWRGDRPGRGGHLAWSGRYNRIGRGYVVPGYLRAPTFVVSDWWSYGLLRPGYGSNWIRYYDDALLIDGGGRVIDSRYGVDWDRMSPRDYPDYGFGDDGYEPGNYDRGFRTEVRPGYPHVWRSGPGAPDVTVRYGGGGSTVVVVQNPSVTTTTTTTYYETIGGHRPAKAKKVWRPKARCNCK